MKTIAPRKPKKVEDNLSDSWILRYVCPNSAGRVSVKMWDSLAPNCSWMGFSLSLQEVLDYQLFKREATRATGVAFAWEPAERDRSGAAWLKLLRDVMRYPEKRLTDMWGPQCPGATSRATSRHKVAVA
jgi:hypothetical protein